MNWQRHWLNLRLALVFLTRIPITINEQIDDQDINQTSAYFVIAGYGIGLLMITVLWLTLVLPDSVAVLLTMAFGLMLTGAFHEDGLADTFDGVGGGWTAEQKLSIMKDSRLGTYGACALFLALTLKYVLLLSLLQVSLFTVALLLVVCQGLSRGLAVSLIASMDYLTLDEQSKTKPVAKSLPENAGLLLSSSALVGVVALYSMLPIDFWDLLLVAVIVIAIRWFFVRFIQRKLGGYTGDVLGAAQQVFELSLYIMLLATISGAQ